MKSFLLFLCWFSVLPLVVAQTAPVITTHPTHQAVAPGGAVTLSVVATGTAPLTYQWKLNGTAIAGATQASYAVANTQLAQAGRYQVVVTNAGGTVHSAPAEVRLTGALWGMGSDEDGQLGIGTRKYVTNPVPVSREVKKIAAGSTHSLILKVDGSLWGLGSNNFGQLGDGTSTDYSTPVQVATGVSAIASGYEHSLFVANDGTLWGMGLSFSSNFRPVQVATGVSAAVAGYRHSLFIKHDGTLWAVGSNESGQLGDGTTTARGAPVQVASEVSAVAAGGAHSLFLKKDGTLWGMGRNFFGQLGNGTTSASTSPVQVTTGVSAIAAGGDHSLFVRMDGTLWTVGENKFGQLGDGSMSRRSIPAQVATGVSAIAASIGHSMFVKIDGTLWAMGANFTGQLGDGTTNSRSTPIQIATGVAGVATGNGGVARLLGHSLFVKTDGSLWAMGANEAGQLGLGTSTERVSPMQVATGVSATAAGRSHSLFVQGDGALWAMGWNVSGQVGSGSSYWEPRPVRVATRASEVAAGSFHSHFVQWDGTLWAMGQSAMPFGQVPGQVSSEVSSVAAGGSHTLFVRRDGTLWAMGSNQNGQLGDGTTTDRALPVQVATGVSAVAASLQHSLFVKYDGTLWAMGYDGFDPLPGRTTPVQVAAGVSVIAAGAYHILFIKNDSTLWAMGYNSQGQLGDGLMSDGITPVQVATGVSAVAAGDYHSLFVKTDGTLWATGANAHGQLGDGTRTSRSTPVQVASGVSAVAAGGNHSFFIQSSGLGTVPTITTSPAGGLVARGSPVTLTAAATGSGLIDYRWQKDGVDLPGARGSTLYLPFFESSDAGQYRVVVTNSAGSVTSTAAALETLVAPSITTPPQPQVLTAPGGTATFSVIASGSPVLTYQWARNGVPLAGATNATLTLSNVQPSAVGTYTVTVTNGGGSVRSADVALEIRQAGQAAAHAAPLGGYVAGRAVTVTSSLSYTGTPSALSWTVLLPAGWTFGTASNAGAAVAPVAGQTEVIDWAWSEIPASPVTFSYTLNVPAGQTAAAELVALAGVRGTVTQQFLAQPDPLSLSRLVTHLADTDRNFRIGLLELTRVIELYNTRSGSVRTGAYAVATAVTEDGFVTAPERTSGALVTLGVHHSADVDRDGKIGLLELTRVIELYNYRVAGARTGQYRVQEGTEDGFAPGP
jgi:alpha-tubulin suppressor-like RCC1 family protein